MLTYSSAQQPAKDEDAEAYTKELAQAHTTNQLRNQDQTQEMWLQSPSLIAEHMPTSTRLHLLVPNAPLPLAHPTPLMVGDISWHDHILGSSS